MDTVDINGGAKHFFILNVYLSFKFKFVFGDMNTQLIIDLETISTIISLFSTIFLFK